MNSDDTKPLDGGEVSPEVTGQSAAAQSDDIIDSPDSSSDVTATDQEHDPLPPVGQDKATDAPLVAVTVVKLRGPVTVRRPHVSGGPYSFDAAGQVLTLSPKDAQHLVETTAGKSFGLRLAYVDPEAAHAAISEATAARRATALAAMGRRGCCGH